jgi:hypothetical protein
MGIAVFEHVAHHNQIKLLIPYSTTTSESVISLRSDKRIVPHLYYLKAKSIRTVASIQVAIQ